MPEAILKFQLPEESSEFKTCVNAGRFKSALDDIYQEFRSVTKHGREGLTPDMEKAYDLMYTKFHEILGENGVDIFEE